MSNSGLVSRLQRNRAAIVAGNCKMADLTNLAFLPFKRGNKHVEKISTAVAGADDPGPGRC